MTMLEAFVKERNEALFSLAYGGGQRPLVRSRTAAVRSE